MQSHTFWSPLRIRVQKERGWCVSNTLGDMQNQALWHIRVPSARNEGRMHSIYDWLAGDRGITVMESKRRGGHGINTMLRLNQGVCRSKPVEDAHCSRLYYGWWQAYFLGMVLHRIAARREIYEFTFIYLSIISSFISLLWNRIKQAILIHACLIKQIWEL